MAKKGKNAIIINLEFVAAVIAVVSVRMLPLKVAYFIANICSRIFFLIDIKHRRRTINHILHVNLVSDYRKAREIALKNFIHLGKVGVEFVKLDQFLNFNNINQHITYNVNNEIKEALQDPRGTVCASAHYGNWEITGLSLSIMFRPIVSIGRKFDNPKINDYIFKKRKAFNQEIFSQKGAIKQMITGLRQQKLLGILTDQYPGDSQGVNTKFFSHPTKSHDSPALLHLKTGAPLLLIVTRRLDNNFHFELIIRGPFQITPTGNKVKDLENLTQQINDEFEKIVKENPEQWLWSHRRWLDIYRKKK